MVVPIRGIIGMTVVRIRILIGTTVVQIASAEKVTESLRPWVVSAYFIYGEEHRELDSYKELDCRSFI